MKTKNKGLHHKNRIVFRTKTHRNRKKPNNYIENSFQTYLKSNFDVYNLLDNRPESFIIPFLRFSFIFCILVAFCWMCYCYYLSHRWIMAFTPYIPLYLSYILVFSIALIPGFMNMYLLISYLYDRRKTYFHPFYFPSITILIAAYNEENYIKKTLLSIQKQIYPANIQIILIDDGSHDNTISIAESLKLKNLTILKAQHKGKAHALNKGLIHAENEYIVTVDADTILDHHAIYELMKKLLSSSKNTVACAGSIFVKNEDQSILTQLQFWDYLLAISIIKRSQSFINSTLVAQGAFSAYKKSVLMDILGWPNLVGEDIVLTWSILNQGYETTYAERAIAFTSAPIKYKSYFHQRTRWARGLIEAFIQHKKIIFKRKYYVFFVYWNILFIFIDLIRFIIFFPSILSLLYGSNLFYGPYFFILLFTSFINNFIFYIGQRKLFKSFGYFLKLNPITFVFYSVFYQYLMNFPVVYGYYLEFFKKKKSWGTK